jgi:hypothetical protein
MDIRPPPVDLLSKGKLKRSTVTTLGDEIRNIPKSPASTGEAPGTLNILVFDEKQQALIKEIFPKDVSAASEQIDKLRIGEFVQDPSLQSTNTAQCAERDPTATRNFIRRWTCSDCVCAIGR